MTTAFTHDEVALLRSSVAQTANSLVSDLSDMIGFDPNGASEHSIARWTNRKTYLWKEIQKLTALERKIKALQVEMGNPNIKKVSENHYVWTGERT